jgi:L-fucose isomerase-like protein
MQVDPTTFALFFGNRGFFPADLMGQARGEMTSRLTELGYDYIIMDEEATRHGAVETRQEGEIYARFLRQHYGEFGGVVACFPNFGNENGAIAALRDCCVPILVQGYPDELDKMGNATRRDSFCGLFSIGDVFRQNRLPFTMLQPHTVAVASDMFANQLNYFDRVCRVTNGLRRATIGAIGARTTDFKTVRFDELTAQAHGITMETFDLLGVYMRMEAIDPASQPYLDMQTTLTDYADWSAAPAYALDKNIRLAVVLLEIIDEFALSAIGLRCWSEFQQYLRFSPCVVVSLLNNLGIPTACEVDMGNALMMLALRLASGAATTCLDWNNNFAAEDDKCVLFHCGPVPTCMMCKRGRITDHEILANAFGKGCGFGCNVGHIAPSEITFGSFLTEEGKLKSYIGKGMITDDELPADNFGCAGVMKMDDLQTALQRIELAGHRHHVSVVPADGNEVIAPMQEAFEKYLGYDPVLML